MRAKQTQWTLQIILLTGDIHKTPRVPELTVSVRQFPSAHPEAHSNLLIPSSALKCSPISQYHDRARGQGHLQCSCLPSAALNIMSMAMYALHFTPGHRTLSPAFLLLSSHNTLDMI